MTATHRPLNMAGRSWTARGQRAAFESSRPGYAVQIIATGEVLSSDGVTPSVWRTKAVAQVIADHPMDWPTIALHMDLEYARELGRKAFEAGEMAAPILNAEIAEAIAGLPVGGGAVEIFLAYSEGWTAANLAAPWE